MRTLSYACSSLEAPPCSATFGRIPAAADRFYKGTCWNERNGAYHEKEDHDARYPRGSESTSRVSRAMRPFRCCHPAGVDHAAHGGNQTEGGICLHDSRQWPGPG